METFFRNSRLHFIGTWRTRIEALMAEVEAAAPQPLPPAARGERARGVCVWVVRNSSRRNVMGEWVNGRG